MNSQELESKDYSFLETLPPYPGDMVFKLDGMSTNEYITKLTEEMNAIDFDSIPFDK